MPKKSIKEFKEILGAFKKPKLKGVPDGVKKQLDKDVGDKDFDKFIEDSASLFAEKKEYFVDLVAYKLAKHMDSGSDSKYTTWLSKIPEEARRLVVEKILPRGVEDERVKKAYAKAYLSGNSQMVALIAERDPDGTAPLNVELMPQMFKASMSKGLKNSSDVELAQTSRNALSGMKPADIVEIARSNSKRFFTVALPGYKDNESFVKTLADPNLRDELEKIDPRAWKKFVDDTPMLKALFNAELEIDRLGLTETSDVMSTMFDAVLNDIPLGYYASPLDPNHTIMAGSTENSQKVREGQKQFRAISGETIPDTPATDCHHLLYVTETMMKMVPGHTPTIVNQSCPNMLMTKPLASIPGKGLLDRNFPGNVFDKTRAATGRVLFTGDGGINSHTWLLVDGTPYDPVLGTKGAGVDGAVEHKLDWVIPKRLASAGGGLYAVQIDDLKPATNVMGFGTGYILTDTPRELLTEEEIGVAGL